MFVIFLLLLFHLKITMSGDWLRIVNREATARCFFVWYWLLTDVFWLGLLNWSLCSAYGFLCFFILLIIWPSFFYVQASIFVFSVASLFSPVSCVVVSGFSKNGDFRNWSQLFPGPFSLYTLVFYDICHDGFPGIGPMLIGQYFFWQSFSG